MKRITLLVTAAILAAMLMSASPASAQVGCKAFGNGVAYNVQNGTLREDIPAQVPENDDVHFYQGLLCS